jgi:hypothetical protein
MIETRNNYIRPSRPSALPKKADVAIYCGFVRFERKADILEIV